ncbi:NAD(P)/FAD-dependent oxidoreductase [bacterium]|nr:NAD(P)/FAD-dependent oxidoreductase [bacterium]
MEQYDSIIIGAGPAGIQASIYLGRLGLKTAVVGRKSGSRLNWAHVIDNYFGFSDGIDGASLLENGFKQAERFNVKIFDEEAINISKNDNAFLVKTAATDFSSKSLIFATGVANQSSGILKEKDLTGKGVAFCVMCDGIFFKDKKVVVIGEGDYAAKEALELLDFTQDISIYSNGKDFDISNKYVSELKNHNIALLKEKIKEFVGDTKVSGAVLDDGREIKFDGAFIAVGMSSSATLSMNLGVLSKNNYIIVDSNFKTNIDGVFAAGDVTGSGMQVSTAIGSAAKAAMSAISYIKGLS